MDFIKPYEIKYYNSNISYLLKENSSFSKTEFRVLVNKSSTCFIRCCQVLLNGQVQLIYFSERYVPLINMLSTMESVNCISIIGDLINNILAIKKNGFLSCQNVDVSLENIFVNPATNQSKIIYLPLSSKLYPNLFIFERSFRESLNKIIHSTNKIPSSKIVEFSRLILNDSNALEDIYTNINIINSYNHKEITTPNKTSESLSLVLTSTNAPSSIQFVIDKDNYIIGRKESEVDGYISFSKMVGRKHCKINMENNMFYIVDLESSNGTYINGKRMLSNQPIEINNLDRIRIANIEFSVDIR